METGPGPAEDPGANAGSPTVWAVAVVADTIVGTAAELSVAISDAVVDGSVIAGVLQPAR